MFYTLCQRFRKTDDGPLLLLTHHILLSAWHAGYRSSVQYTVRPASANIDQLHSKRERQTERERERETEIERERESETERQRERESAG